MPLWHKGYAKMAQGSLLDGSFSLLPYAKMA